MVTPFIPRGRPNVKHPIAGYFKATTAYTNACTDVSGGTRVRHWQSARRLWSGGGCTFPWMIVVVLPYHAVHHATDGTDP